MRGGVAGRGVFVRPNPGVLVCSMSRLVASGMLFAGFIFPDIFHAARVSSCVCISGRCSPVGEVNRLCIRGNKPGCCMLNSRRSGYQDCFCHVCVTITIVAWSCLIYRQASVDLTEWRKGIWVQVYPLYYECICYVCYRMGFPTDKSFCLGICSICKQVCNYWFE